MKIILLLLYFLVAIPSMVLTILFVKENAYCWLLGFLTCCLLDVLKALLELYDFKRTIGCEGVNKSNGIN